MDTFHKNYKAWRLFIQKRYVEQKFFREQLSTIDRTRHVLRVYIPFKGIELFLIIKACHALGQIIVSAEGARLSLSAKYKTINEGGLSNEQYERKLQQAGAAWAQGRTIFVEEIDVDPEIYDRVALKISQAKTRAIEAAKTVRATADSIWAEANDPIKHFSPEERKTLPMNKVINENSDEFSRIIEFLFRQMRKLAYRYS